MSAQFVSGPQRCWRHLLLSYLHLLLQLHQLLLNLHHPLLLHRSRRQLGLAHLDNSVVLNFSVMISDVISTKSRASRTNSCCLSLIRVEPY